MKLIRIENDLYSGSNNRKSFYDLHIPENFNGKLLVLVHGFKGFKDWGAWNLVDFEFTYAGFGFAKFNLSHNGGNHIYAKDFPDLEAFSKNTYSKEVNDIHLFLSHLESLELPEHSTHLIGHSRGGGVAILAAAQSKKVASICTWASICDIERRMPQGEELDAWRRSGVRYETNTRTQQEMPIGFGLYEDFIQNKEHLSIQKACALMSIPRFVIHGADDETVNISEGHELSEWLNVPLFEIPDANHAFGAKHPMDSYTLPKNLKNVVDLTMNFIQNL